MGSDSEYHISQIKRAIRGMYQVLWNALGEPPSSPYIGDENAHYRSA